MINCFTLKAQFMLSVNSMASSELAKISFLGICISHLTALMFICSLGGLYFISIFSSSQTVFIVFRYESTARVWFFSRTVYKLMKLSTKLLISLKLPDLDTQTTGHLYYRSIAIRIYGPPVKGLKLKLPERSICVSCPGSVKTGSLFCFRSTILGTLNSNRNSFIQCMYYTCFQNASSSRATKIICYRPAFSSSRDVRSVALPPIASLFLRGK